MWCSRGCLGPSASSDACLWHVSLAGGARRRGCAAAGVSVIFNGLLVLPHRGPQAMLVQAEHVQLRLLARPAGHDRAPLLVDVEHQLRRLLTVVAEQLLEH